MKKHKLVVIFDDIEIDGLGNIFVFSNQLDAEEYFYSTGYIKKIILEPEYSHFTFIHIDGWRATGKAYWAIDKSL